jgi:hypothetical protein
MARIRMHAIGAFRRRIYIAVAWLAIMGSVCAGANKVLPTTDLVRLQEAMRFRTEFGLRADPSVIAMVENDPTLWRKYGIALTKAEQADIDRRVAVSQQLGPLNQHLAMDPDYAGMYIDQAAGGIIDIATAGDPASLAPVVAQFGPSGVRYRTHQVPYSRIYLESILNRVESDLQTPTVDKSQITSVAVDTIGNRVKIGVLSPTQEIRENLLNTYGPAIEVDAEQVPTPMSCTGQKNCVPPVKGGLELGFQEAGHGQGLCTSSFSARTTTGKVVLVTAGHCAGSHNRSVYNGQGPFNSFIGTVANSTFYWDEPNPPVEVDADAAYISLAPGMTGSNLVYLGQNHFGRIIGWDALSDSEVISGKPVCKMGATTSMTCGITKSVSYHYPETEPGKPVVKILKTVDITNGGGGGDSGSPVFMYSSGSQDDLILVGVFWEGGSAGSGYSPIDLVDSSLGITPCTTDCGATYHAITPARVLDTRPSSHVGNATTLKSQTKQTFSVTGIPLDAVAVTGNLTVTGPTAAGYVTLAPALSLHGVPSTSTINFPAGDTRANGVTVALSYAGTLDVIYRAASTSATADVIFDVTGYFTNDAAGMTYHTQTPTRVLDTRPSSHVGNATTLQSQTKQYFSVGLPSNAKAVTGNLTVTGQTALGYVTLAPALSLHGVPSTSTINFPAGDTRANGVTVALSGSGTLDVIYRAASTSATADVIFDVTGYFTNDATGMTYHTLTPNRVLDTRPSSHAGNATTLQSQTMQNFSFGVESSNAFAVTGNLTVTGPTAVGYVTLAPALSLHGGPSTSTINFPAGDTRANNVSLPLFNRKSLAAMYWAATTKDTADIIFDVTGYYAY